MLMQIFFYCTFDRFTLDRPEILDYILLRGIGVREFKFMNTTDACLSDLSRGCRWLITIDLADCSEITDAGVCELVEGCPGLTNINLGYCSNITDVAIVKLGESCHGLTSIDLWDCSNITRGVKDKLRAQGCKVSG